jgi:hypothetical protein
LIYVFHDLCIFLKLPRPAEPASAPPCAPRPLAKFARAARGGAFLPSGLSANILILIVFIFGTPVACSFGAGPWWPPKQEKSAYASFKP